MRVTRRAVADSLSLVGWNLKALMYPALYSLCVILIYWDTAGRVAAQQEVSVVIVGLKAAALAFGVVLVPNLAMAPIRMERELEWKAEKWLAKLNTQIRRNKELSESPKSVAQAELSQPLSDEALELLLEAAQDQGGYVARRESVTDIRIVTNGREFGEPGNARDQATWEAALDELYNGQLVQYQNSKVSSRVFRVTKAGYELAEALTKPDD